MDKINELMIGAQIRTAKALERIADNTVQKKEDGDSQVVVALILIVVAIGLCIVFQNHIKEAMETVGKIVDNTINSLTNFSVNMKASS